MKIMIVTGPNGLKEMATELQEVVGWYDLGLHFSAQRHVLETIRLNHREIQDQKMALFKWWLKTSEKKERKWSKIVVALASTGYRSLAEKIAVKYGKRT